MQTPQTQTPAITHMIDTSIPMDINQSQPRPETHTCYICSDQGHLSCACLKPQKQRIWSTLPPDVDIMGLVAQAMEVAMDAREMVKKAEQAKESGKTEEDFQASQQ